MERTLIDKRFIEITIPSLVGELNRLNNNIERALDYYSLENSGSESMLEEINERVRNLEESWYSKPSKKR